MKQQIVTKAVLWDGEQATEYDMPQEDKEKTPEKYETVSFDEFESIGIVNAKDKAARFYSVMFFITRVEVLCIASA